MCSFFWVAPDIHRDRHQKEPKKRPFLANDELIISIIKTKAIKRQYHTYFDWEKSTNANSFFSLFGEDFKNKMAKQVKETPKLETAIRAFLQLGQERNKLVHQNFAEIVLDKTADEIYKLYQTALLFVDIIKSELIKKDQKISNEGNETTQSIRQIFFQKFFGES